MSAIKLYDHKYGPFPHIVRMALVEKGVQLGTDVQLESIDPAAKPEHFVRQSPTGKTPLLVVDGQAIFETSVILEYVDQRFAPTQSLRAEDPLTQARDRSWSAFGMELLMDAFHAVMAKGEAEHRTHHHEVIRKLARLEGQVTGAYFGGEQLRLVDLVYTAWLLRQRLFQQAFGWKVFDDFPKVSRWADTVLERPSARQTLPEDFDTVVSGFIGRNAGYITRS